MCLNQSEDLRYWVRVEEISHPFQLNMESHTDGHVYQWVTAN
jgi:hypothetical protein